MSSELMKLAAEAKRAVDEGDVSKPQAKRLLKILSQHKQRKAGRWEVNKARNDFERRRSQGIINRWNQSGGLAAQGNDQLEADSVRAVSQQMGGYGAAMDSLATGNASSLTDDQLRSAEKLLEPYGVKESFSKDDPKVQKKIRSALQEAVRNIEGDDVEEPPRNKQDLHSTVLRKATDEPESQTLSPVHTVSSSNVHSFQYDHASKTLYVTFLAPVLNSSAILNYKSEGGMRAMAGDLGKTVIGKSSNPGSVYAYYGVPVRIFKKLITAGSAGKAVWDELRIRGTVWGHQYQYNLVQGAYTTGEKGRAAWYVPRKATQVGFRSRSVAVPGRGRRRYVSSSLPDQQGHEVFRGRPPAVDRGRPEPPDRGR